MSLIVFAHSVVRLLYIVFVCSILIISIYDIFSGPVSLPAFPPPKKEKPPPPPPRPFKTHGRSSSLDLNKLNKNLAPPTVPPRVSPNIQAPKKLVNQRSEGDYSTQKENTAQFANFEQFEKYENVNEGIFPGNYYSYYSGG